MSCTECGMATEDQGEFHPYAFCVWKKAGLDPWATLLDINTKLGLNTAHWPKRPPLIRQLRTFAGEGVASEPRSATCEGGAKGSRRETAPARITAAPSPAEKAGASS